MSGNQVLLLLLRVCSLLVLLFRGLHLHLAIIQARKALYHLALAVDLPWPAISLSLSVLQLPLHSPLLSLHLALSAHA
jgi:hypothetical protein